MRYITQVFLATIATQTFGAPIDSFIACKSACGLDEAVLTKDCEKVTVESGVCQHVFRDTEGNVKFTMDENVTNLVPLTVQDAIDTTQAPEHSCFALCFDDQSCRSRGSHCTEHGVCSHLFWNKQKRTLNEFAFHVEGPEDVSNQASPVTCDADLSDNAVGEPVPHGQVDPCVALCEMSVAPKEPTCRFVAQTGDSCNRMYWTDSSKSAVEFSARTLQGTAVRVIASEAADLLTVDDCQTVCDSVVACAASSSYCRSENRTCKDLFYLPTPDTTKESLIPCYGSACPSDATPVMCRPVDEPASRPSVHSSAEIVIRMVSNTDTSEGTNNATSGNRAENGMISGENQTQNGQDGIATENGASSTAQTETTTRNAAIKLSSGIVVFMTTVVLFL